MRDENEITPVPVEHYYKRRYTAVSKKEPSLLNSYFLKIITKHCFELCSKMYAREMKGHLLSGETMADLEQEAYDLFHTSLKRFNPAKLTYRYLKPKVNNGFDLAAPVYKEKQFFAFTKDYITLQKPHHKLKKKYGSKYEVYRLGAEEWLFRQFYSAFKPKIGWTLKNSHENKSVAVKNLGGEYHEATELDVERSLVQEFQAAEDPRISELKDLIGKDILFRDFLLDLFAVGTKDYKIISVSELHFKKHYGKGYLRLVKRVKKFEKLIMSLYPDAKVEQTAKSRLKQLKAKHPKIFNTT